MSVQIRRNSTTGGGVANKILLVDKTTRLYKPHSIQFKHHRIQRLRSPDPCIFIMCDSCTWLRQNLEYCAQRRTLRYFDLSDASEIAFLSRISFPRDFTKFHFFTKFQFFRHHAPDLGLPRNRATEFSGSSRAQNLKLHIFI